MNEKYGVEWSIRRNKNYSINFFFFFSNMESSLSIGENDLKIARKMNLNKFVLN